MLAFFQNKTHGSVQDLNLGPLAPKAKIIPLDQQATPFASTSVARKRIDIGIKKTESRGMDRLCNPLFEVLVFMKSLKRFACKFLYLFTQ